MHTLRARMQVRSDAPPEPRLFRVTLYPVPCTLQVRSDAPPEPRLFRVTVSSVSSVGSGEGCLGGVCRLKPHTSSLTDGAVFVLCVNGI